MIGARLQLAEKTVMNHVTTLLRKLELERRTQTAAFAARHWDT
jgi:two-component system response regulator DevR